MRKILLLASLMSIATPFSAATAQPPPPLRYDPPGDAYRDDEDADHDRYNDAQDGYSDDQDRAIDAQARYAQDRDRYYRERAEYERSRDAYYRSRDGYYRDRAYADAPPPRAYSGQTWRGDDGRTYCRRTDGTTGLIVGGAGGALIGRAIDGGRHRGVGTILGAGAGALLGRSVEQNSSCR